MFTQQEENLAQQIAELTGAITNALPMEADKADEYLKLISSKIGVAADLPKADNSVKDITENVVDVLAAIADVLPPTEDAKKQRQQRRFKASIGVIRNLLHLFGL